MSQSPSTTRRQHVRYVHASDGTRLAWAESGNGRDIVKAANWLTHLEYEWESPVWKHWLQFFSAHWRFVRYDERGCGMSGWQGGVLTVPQWAADLEMVIDAAQRCSRFGSREQPQGIRCSRHCRRASVRCSR